MKLLIKIIILGFFIIYLGCSTNHNSKIISNDEQVVDNVSKKENPKYASLVKPKIGKTFVYGDEISFEFLWKNDSLHFDSAKLFVNDEFQYLFKSNQKLSYWNSKKGNVGINDYFIIIYCNNKAEQLDGYVFVLSDIIPKERKFKVINTYHHDKYAYTQGLIYEDGFIYEGTGQYNESSLRKINYKTGELLQSYKLPNDVFGEGIVSYQNKIIQLTWKKWIGFVYDKKELKLLRKFNYPVPMEGWGITYNGQYLIMSDGSNNLIFLDPDTFKETKRIQVVDNQGEVGNLNELEFVNGKVYANIYLTDFIVAIDPESGKVLEKINLKGILPKKDYHSSIDVLNGIAYNSESETFFITGKYWPKMFEVIFK